MATLWLLVGPPCSGKSTFASELVSDTCIYVNQDTQGKAHFEHFKKLVELEVDIVVDRMNFNRQQRKRYIDEARRKGHDVICKEFLTDSKTRRKRFLSRKDHPTIKNETDFSNASHTFFKNYEKPEHDEGIDTISEKITNHEKKNYIIIDLDGTLCNLDHRLHHIQGEGKKNWKGFFNDLDKDTIYEDTLAVINSLKATHSIIFVSGRPDEYREQTVKWLTQHGLDKHKLFMRPRGNFQDDTVVKEMLYRYELSQFGEPLLVVDDRLRVINMWTSLGFNVIVFRENDV
jgi:predicted kinase